MNVKYRIFNALILLVLLLTFRSAPAQAVTDETSIPPGFELVAGGQGVTSYQKNYPNGSPDYVQVADLNQGAQIQLLNGEIANPGQSQGVYGGDNPKFGRLSIRQFWNKFTASNPGAFCVSNGQFFKLADSPTALPFSLKKDGQILSDGYAINEFIDQKLILEIWPDRLDIRELSQQNLYSSSAPDIVAGLAEDAEKASKKAVGRTFVGIDDRDGDQLFETFLLFNTRVSKPSAAADVLRAFGAEKVMMLDGGGSTQLVCADQALIDTERLIPQAIGIAAGNLPVLDASLIQPISEPQVIDDQQPTIGIELKNRGSQSWNIQNTWLEITDQADRQVARLPLPEKTTTGQTITFPWKPQPDPADLQVYTLSVVIDDAKINLEDALSIIYLPGELGHYRPGLQQDLATVTGLPPMDLERWVNEWFKKQTGAGQIGLGGGPSKMGNPGSDFIRGEIADVEKVDLTNVIWIPALMVPLTFILLAIIRRVNTSISY